MCTCMFVFVFVCMCVCVYVCVCVYYVCIGLDEDCFFGFQGNCIVVLRPYHYIELNTNGNNQFDYFLYSIYDFTYFSVLHLNYFAHIIIVTSVESLI